MDCVSIVELLLRVHVITIYDSNRYKNQKTNGPVKCSPDIDRHRVIIYINFVEIESLMLHAKFTENYTVNRVSLEEK